MISISGQLRFYTDLMPGGLEEPPSPRATRRSGGACRPASLGAFPKVDCAAFRTGRDRIERVKI